MSPKQQQQQQPPPQIRREVRRDEDETDPMSSGAGAPIRLTTCDQMLIKFYLKHIEENLNELGAAQRSLLERLASSSAASSTSTTIELAHKLAITGHKLVFICDTLQRNINNLNLKQSLFESSNSLCGSLKVYMIRLKAFSSASASCDDDQATTTLKNLILDAITSVHDCAGHFKSIILKYYFKTF